MRLLAFCAGAILCAAAVTAQVSASPAKAFVFPLCSIYVSNQSTQTLVYAPPAIGVGTPVSLNAIEASQNLSTPGLFDVTDTVAPGDTGATWKWSGGLLTSCSGLVVWNAPYVRILATVENPAFGDGAFSCAAVGVPVLTCTGVSVEDAHMVEMEAVVTVPSTVKTCAYRVHNDTGEFLVGSDGAEIDSGSSGPIESSIGLGHCSVSVSYWYSQLAPSTCRDYGPLSPCMNRGTVDIAGAYPTTASPTCTPPAGNVLPIACTVTVDESAGDALMLDVEVTWSRSTSGMSKGPTSGTPRDDVGAGGTGADRFDGGAGDDTWHPGGGNDILRGGTGSDLISGGAGADNIGGGSGADWLLGGSGPDTILGGSGDDHLFGGAGDDRVWSRDGEPDVVECGTGRDFVVADRADKTRDCESVLINGSHFPQRARRAGALLLEADLPGGGWGPAGPSGRFATRDARARSCRGAAPGAAEVAATRAFSRLGHGLSYVSWSQATFPTTRAAERARARLTPAGVIACLSRKGFGSMRPLPFETTADVTTAWRLSHGTATLDVVTARVGRTIFGFAFFATKPARPLPYELALVRTALSRAP